MAEDVGVWVYAVTGSMAPQWLSGVSGVAGQPVRVVTGGGLCAAVSTVSLAEFGEEALRHHLEDIVWLEAVARLHHKVIEVIAQHVPVVPMRLATVYRGDGRVAAMLAKRHDDLGSALTRVTHRTEWGVKVSAAPSGVTRESAPDDADAVAGGGLGSVARGAAGSVPDGGPGSVAGGGAGSVARGAAGSVAGGGAGSVARGAAGSVAGGGAGSVTGGGPGAAFLRRRRSQLAATDNAKRAAATSAERIHASLSRLAAAFSARAPQDPQLSGQTARMIFNGAYLVDDDKAADFSAAVSDLSDQYPNVRIELTGPWPPYSFAYVEQSHEATGEAGAAV